MGQAAQLLLAVISVLGGPRDDAGSTTEATPEQPLLVIVERGRGATANPDQVRRAIAEELKRSVVGPTDVAARSASQMLVVTLAPDSVAMQMRTAGDPAPRRRIEPLASGDSSLRVVAWLAGNVARDQATELMDAASGDGVPEPAVPVGVISSPTRPLPSPPAVVAAPPATARPVEVDHAPWRVGVSFGRAAEYGQGTSSLPAYQEAITRFELLSPTTADHWSWSVTFDAMTDRLDRLWGRYNLSAGFGRRFTLIDRWFSTDVGAGAGLTMFRGYAPVRYTQYDGTSPIMLTYETLGPSPMVNLSGSLAFTHWRFGELVMVMRLDDNPAWWQYPWVSLAGGLRMSL
jgi:hypothetical protein